MVTTRDIASYPDADPSLDHSTMIGVVMENTTVVQDDRLNPIPQFSGSLNINPQIDSFRARAQAAEEATDKMLDDLMEAQGQLQRALAETAEKDRKILELERRLYSQQGHSTPGDDGTGVVATALGSGSSASLEQLRSLYCELEREADQLRVAAAAREQADLIGQSTVTQEAKVRELQGLVDFFRKNSEQSTRLARELQEENRRLKGMMPRLK